LLLIKELSWHVADSYNLRYVSCKAWEFISDKELNGTKFMYLGKDTNRKLLGSQPIMIHFLIIFMDIPRLKPEAVLKP
jgi:hypothetical protein